MVCSPPDLLIDAFDATGPNDLPDESEPARSEISRLDVSVERQR
jgi:hypothetical protein